MQSCQKCTKIQGGTGIPNADMRMYITADDTETCQQNGILAYATTCQQDQYGRPTFGLANFCPGRLDKVQNAKGTASAYEKLNSNMINVAIHELGHALGFQSVFFKDFMKPDGTPYMTREEKFEARYWYDVKNTECKTEHVNAADKNNEPPQYKCEIGDISVTNDPTTDPGDGEWDWYTELPESIIKHIPNAGKPGNCSCFVAGVNDAQRNVSKCLASTCNTGICFFFELYFFKKFRIYFNTHTHTFQVQFQYTHISRFATQVVSTVAPSI